MKEWINTILAHLALTKWMFVIVWRRLNGRWHIFRDAPDWVVYAFIGVELEQLGELANEEIELRIRNLVRRADAATAENERELAVPPAGLADANEPDVQEGSEP